MRATGWPLLGVLLVAACDPGTIAGGGHDGAAADQAAGDSGGAAGDAAREADVAAAEGGGTW